MDESKELLKSAAAEINCLRRQNEMMATRLQMFDQLMILLNTEPRHPSMGMSPDLAWQIEQYLKNH